MSKVVFGVDLGGTTVKMGIFDPEGNVQDKWEIKTRKDNNGSNILPDIAASIKAKMSEKGILKGICSPLSISRTWKTSSVFHSGPIFFQ